MGMVLLYLKFDDPNSAFTHTLNNLRYYINCGIVVLICSAVILTKPRQEIVLFAFITTLPINISLQIFTGNELFCESFLGYPNRLIIDNPSQQGAIQLLIIII
ncbi:MAG: hypothetical protein CM15mP102_00620 [Flavobacteriales bacterium]|nr:MAG: hypothetical protein CM15mP102_00620 [Flavobacteriales bacterium]